MLNVCTVDDMSNDTKTTALIDQAVADVTRTCTTFPTTAWFVRWATVRGAADQATAIETAVRYELTGK